MSSDPTKISLRVFWQLLRLYPSQFRSDYGSEMLHVFRSVARDEYAQGGARSLTALWLRTIPDVLVSAADEHIQEGTMRLQLIRGSALAGLAGGALLIAYSLLANMRPPGVTGGAYRDVDDIGGLLMWGLLLFAACLGGMYLRLARQWQTPAKITCLLSLAGVAWSGMMSFFAADWIVMMAGLLMLFLGVLLTGLFLLRQPGMQYYALLLIGIGISLCLFNTEDARVLLLAIAGMLIMALSVLLFGRAPQDQSEPPLAA